jgi:hypothetical protein
VIALQIISVAFGTVVVMAVLISALETVILPRNGFTRISRAVFAVADRLLIRQWRQKSVRDSLRSLYAPIALVSLPLVWTLAVTFGFSFVFWGVNTGSAQRSFEISGSSLFTLGFAEPEGIGRIWMTFVEATIGLGLVALLISYLPTIYAAHHEREKGISVMRPFAGSPPSPVELLASLDRLGALDNPEIWRSATNWLLDLDQTHCAFPALCYFPESRSDQSWVASIGSVLDAAALLLSASDFATGNLPREDLKGPMMALAYGMPAVVRIGISASLPIDPPAKLLDLVSSAAGVPPVIAVRQAEYFDALDRLGDLVAVPDQDRDRCWAKFAWIRSGYDQAVRGLAGLTKAAPAPWTTDRPAHTARPRLLLRHPIAVDWTLPPPEPTGPPEPTSPPEAANPPGPTPTT